jgi:hypothetical protein
MSGWSPPTLSRGQLAGIIVGLLAVAAYSVVIIGQLLLVVIPAVAVVVVYLIWRFVRAVEAIADAQQRRAANAQQRRAADPDE